MDCLFCRIIAGEEPCAQVYADDLCMAFMDIYPLGEGHVLLIPQQYIPHAHMHLIPRRRGDGLRFLYRLSLHLTGLCGFGKPMSTLREQAERIAAGMRSSDQEAE